MRRVYGYLEGIAGRGRGQRPAGRGTPLPGSPPPDAGGAGARARAEVPLLRQGGMGERGGGAAVRPGGPGGQRLVPVSGKLSEFALCRPGGGAAVSGAVCAAVSGLCHRQCARLGWGRLRFDRLWLFCARRGVQCYLPA